MGSTDVNAVMLTLPLMLMPMGDTDTVMDITDMDTDMDVDTTDTDVPTDTTVLDTDTTVKSHIGCAIFKIVDTCCSERILTTKSLVKKDNHNTLITSLQQVFAAYRTF